MTNLKRCDWVSNDQLYIDYHDNEWGNPVRDDQMMFEFLVLESFQAGLSWLTVLKKRENFRRAFDCFDYEKIANYDEDKVSSLMQDRGIIRNLMKIKATVKNAQSYLKVREEFTTFCNYFWAFTENKTIHNCWEKVSEIPSQTPLSIEISKDLKKRGFTFLGPTTVYAHMQAVGMVNDHDVDCFKRKPLFLADSRKKTILK